MSKPDEEDDIILPETIDLPEEETIPNKPARKPVFIIVTAIAFVGLVISLLVVIINSNKRIADLSSPTCESQSSQYYDSDEFNSSITFARERLRVGDYDSTEHALKQHPLVERMTVTQKYRYYALLADLYSQSAMNDSELYYRYSALAEENLTKIREGEE